MCLHQKWGSQGNKLRRIAVATKSLAVTLTVTFLNVGCIPTARPVLSASALSASSGVGLVPTLVSEAVVVADVEMVQEGGAGTDDLIAPRRLQNPCLESPQRMDLHRELLFNQRIGKNVLNQKSELEKALSKHKAKQIQNQVKELRETPELERAIAERARRLEQAQEQNAEQIETGTNPTLQEVRARLRHAPPSHSPATSAH